jgi:hypothetical protein
MPARTQRVRYRDADEWCRNGDRLDVAIQQFVDIGDGDATLKRRKIQPACGRCDADHPVPGNPANTRA